MAEEHSCIPASVVVIPPGLLTLMFQGEVPSSLRVDSDGAATRADVMRILQGLWEQAMRDCGAPPAEILLLSARQDHLGEAHHLLPGQWSGDVDDGVGGCDPATNPGCGSSGRGPRRVDAA